MANHNESGVIGVLAHGKVETTQQSIDSDHADRKCMEYLPYPDDNFDEVIDDCFQRGNKFTIEHIRRRTGQAFVPNVQVHVKSIVTKRTDECSTAFVDPYLFCITTQHGLNEWITYKRYRHFQDLHKALMNFVGEERKKSKSDLDIIQDENNEYPYFPATNDQIALTNESIVEEHCRILVDYFNKVLRHPKFRAHSAMCEFFDVSCLSFIHGLAVSRKEGYLLEASNDYYCDQHAFFRAQYFCNLCKCYDGPKWFIIKDSYIVDIRPDTHEVCFPILVDRSFQVSTGSNNDIKISNLQRTLVIKCRSTRDCNEWTQHLLNLIEQAKDFVSTRPSRFNSYAPIRENQLAYWFINGKSYMEAVAKALLTAKEEVFITDWWLSPELMLIRPADDETFRLDNILGRIAESGVRVYIMLFKEMSFALALNSFYTKKTLVSKSKQGFIKVIRHPDRYTTDSVLLWSHHEKMVVIDQKIAFVGGIDLCYGRWDDEHMRLVDLADKNDATLKSPSDIAAEKAASGGKETVEAAQITTTQMAEQAGEVPIKSISCLRAAFNPLNEVNEDIKLPASTDANGITYDMKSIAGNWMQSTLTDTQVTNNGQGIQQFTPGLQNIVQTVRKDGEKILEEQQQSIATSTPEVDGKHRYFIGKDYSNAYEKDFNQLEDYTTDCVTRTLVPRMPWHDEALVVFGQTARDVARHFIQRWNIHKCEKYLNNDFYPYLLPKSYDDVEDLIVENSRDFLESEPHRVNAQCVRSVGPWSARTKTVESSIQNAYIQMIDAAKHYIYIENQFFVTIGQDPVVRNQLADVLFRRIERAYNNDEKFRIYIVLPLLPGFDSMNAVQAVLYFIMRSITKGDNSLYRRLENAGIAPRNYINVFGMRNHDILMGRLVTEIIYVHSKLMIIDDRMAICGSANINDRSLVGDRDSEFCIVISDLEEEDSRFNGQPVRVGKFCSSWRKKIFKMLLGIQFENPNNIDITDPVSDEFYSYFQNVATQNTLIYEEVFATMPTDRARTFAQINENNGMAKMKDTDPIEAQKKLKGIQGFIVEYPLYFLNEENYLPSMISREDWWEKPYDHCFANYLNADSKLKLSQASQDIILKSDRIWAESIDDIEEDERYREMTGQYFRDIILTENVFPFLKNEENIIHLDEVIVVYNKAPFHLTNEHDADVRKACRTLPQLKESLFQLYPGCRLEATLGIGYNKTREWLTRVDVPFPKSFIEFQEKQGPTGKYMPSTRGSLMLHIRSDRKDLCFELGRQFCQSIPDDSIAKLDETFGFAHMSSKTNECFQDFTGFIDVDENPKDDEQKAKAALICDGEDVAIHVGGSFALTQKWKHNPIKWNDTKPYWVRHRTAIAIWASIIYMAIVIIIGVAVVCVTSPKQTIKKCELNFISTVSNPIEYNYGPRSVAVCHINNDTWLDIVVANHAVNEIAVFLGHDDGAFRNRKSYSTGNGSSPYMVAVGDFNKDHQIDIAVANFGTNSIGVFLRYENRSFEKQILTSIGLSRPLWIHIADFNNDTLLDIVTANYGTDSISVLLGHGNGSFSNLVMYLTGYDSRPFSVVAGDLNNDNQLDLVIANSGTNNVDILLGDGRGNFTYEKTLSTGSGSHPYSVIVAHFNNDNLMDIAVANYGTQCVDVLLNYGNGTFTQPKTYSLGSSSPYSLTTGDFNKDNQLDIIVTNKGTKNIGVLLSNSNGIFTSPKLYSTGSTSSIAIALDDFNNDGRLDMVIVNDDTNSIGTVLGYDMGFSSQNDYPLGSTPQFVAVADFNNDTRLDIVVTNPFANSVTILLTSDNSSYQNEMIFSTGSSPYGLGLGDFNNDTKLDIVVSNSDNNTVSVLLGFGNGSFENQMIFCTGSRPQGITVGDVNDDSNLDLIIANSEDNTVSVLLGYGNGFFKDQKTFLTGSSPQSVAIGDFNNDTRLDLVITNNYDETVSVLLGYGNGYFEDQMTFFIGSRPSAIVVGDFNNDKWLDIVVTNFDGVNTVSVSLGYGNGSFKNCMAFSTGSYPSSIVVADFNGDKRVDIVVTNYNDNSASLLLGYGNGSFENQKVFAAGYRPHGVAVGDFNNDTKLDIVVTGYGHDQVHVLLYDNIGGLGKEILFASGDGSRVRCVAVADINNDYRLDIIIANYGTDNVGVIFGYGNSTFGTQMLYTMGLSSRPSSLTIGDFNNDAQLDIAVTNSGTKNIELMLGSENGTFLRQKSYDIFSDFTPISIAAGDFNNDRRFDIVVAYDDTEVVSIFVAYDLGFFKNVATYLTGGGPQSVVVGDFNNDTKLDIVVSNGPANTVSILLGYGNGSFENHVTFDTGYFPQSIVVDDFNNDTQLDIVVTNRGDDTVSILIGYGNGHFQDQVKFHTGSYPQSVAVGDFNNDTRLDLVVSNSHDNNVSVLLGYGNGSFENQMKFSTGSHPQGVAVGDFNNDKILDIVVTNANDNNVCLFLGYGNGSFENSGTFDTGFSPEHVAVGDFNNDTRLDIVVTNNIFIESVAVSDLNNDAKLDFVVANSGDNTVSVFVGYGNGSFFQKITYATGSLPLSVAFGDFNNDTRLDFVVTHEGSNNVALFLGYANEAFVQESVLLIGNGSRPRSFIVGDVNNDGNMDIAVVYSSTNNVGIFLGHGNNSFSHQLTCAT
ncbi:unnamed protein product, partial [Rotaria sordida]